MMFVSPHLQSCVVLVMATLEFVTLQLDTASQIFPNGVQ